MKLVTVKTSVHLHNCYFFYGRKSKLLHLLELEVRIALNNKEGSGDFLTSTRFLKTFLVKR